MEKNDAFTRFGLLIYWHINRFINGSAYVYFVFYLANKFGVLYKGTGSGKK